MLNPSQNEDYQKALNHLAFSISHRFRRPIATMLGLLELIRLDLLKEHEHEQAIVDFRTCLDELDRYTRELGCLIHREQIKITGCGRSID